MDNICLDSLDQGEYIFEQSSDKPVPKTERDIKSVIDMRNTDEENVSNTLIIILTNYAKRIIIYKNVGKQFSVELKIFLFVQMLTVI